MHLDLLPGKTSAKYFKDLCQQMNIPVVQEMYTPLRPTDTMSFVMAIREAKPDIVIGIQSEICWTVMSKDMKRVGVELPRISPYFGPLDKETIEAMGDAGVGMLSSLPYAIWEDENVEGIKIIRELAKEWRKGEVPTRHTYYWGWIRAAMIIESIKRGLDKVGYEGLTKDIDKGRKVVRETFANNMKGFTAMGMISPMTVSEEDHRPYNKVRAVEVVKSPVGFAFKVVSDWIECPKLRPEQLQADWWIK
jgi:hypothetical protein